MRQSVQAPSETFMRPPTSAGLPSESLPQHLVPCQLLPLPCTQAYYPEPIGTSRPPATRSQPPQLSSKRPRPRLPFSLTLHRLLRSEVEALVAEKHGINYLTKKRYQVELSRVNREIKSLKAQLESLEKKRTELQEILAE